MQKKTIPITVQLDAKLVSEIETYGEARKAGTPEQAMILALQEFFREHQNCHRHEKVA